MFIDLEFNQKPKLTTSGEFFYTGSPTKKERILTLKTENISSFFTKTINIYPYPSEGRHSEHSKPHTYGLVVMNNGHSHDITFESYKFLRQAVYIHNSEVESSS